MTNTYAMTGPVTALGGRVLTREVPGPHIPTTGLPAHALDFFRVQSIQSNDYRKQSSCFLDVEAMAGIGRLIEGGITDASELLAAETALQALLFHDRIEALVPSVLFVHEPNAAETFITYGRPPEKRTQTTFDLFHKMSAFDHLAAFDSISMKDGRTIGRTVLDPRYPGPSVEAIQQGLASHAKIPELLIGMCELHEVPGFFASNMEKFIDHRGLFQRFYEAIQEPWAKEIKVWQSIRIAVELPPLVAVVLNRASSREKIPEAILEIRELLRSSRDELRAFNARIWRVESEAEAQREQKRIKQVFDSIVPAALQTNIEKRQFILGEILLIPKALKSPLDWVLTHLNPDYKPKNPRALISRLVSARTMADLLSVESLPSLCEAFFTSAEMKSIRKSMPKGQ